MNGPKRQPKLAERLLQFLAWIPLLNRGTIRGDAMAGLTGAIVVLPQGVAFATIAGMPPEYGLYAGMIPAIIAALFGSSMHLVSGPTTAASIVLFSSLSVFAEPGSADYVTLALTLTLMVGIMELALGLARMGALVNFISHSVIVGFTAGAAILIAAKQLKHFFGIELPRGGHLHDILWNFAQQITDINPYVVSVALITLLSGIAVKHWLPKVPYMIAAMVLGSLASVLITSIFGEAAAQIATVGALPQSLPPLSAPDLSLDTIKNLAPAALAVTLFALTEAVSIGRSLASRSGQRIDGNQEFIGQGLSNIFGSFFSGLLMGIVLLVAPLAAYLPKAAMAGILFLVAWGLIDFGEMAHIIKSSKRETAVMGVTFLGALFLELELAIFAGVMLSLILYLERTSHPRIVSRAPDPRLYQRSFTSDMDVPECPQLKFLRIDGSIFFGSVNHVQEAFSRLEGEHPEQKHLAVVAQGINFVDVAGGEVLGREALKRRAHGGALYLIHVKAGLWEPMERCGCLAAVGPNNVFQSKTAAITGIYQHLDKSVCASCDRRIFRECGPKPDT